MEGHPSGQPSWIARGALETGALEMESVESGDRQNEGQLLTAMFLSQWGVMERTWVSSAVRQSCPRRGGGLCQAAERTHQTSLSLFVLIYKMGL